MQHFRSLQIQPVTESGNAGTPEDPTVDWQNPTTPRAITTIEAQGLREDTQILSQAHYPVSSLWPLPSIPMLLHEKWRVTLLHQLMNQYFKLLSNIEIASAYLKRGQERNYQFDWLVKLIQDDHNLRHLMARDIIKEAQALKNWIEGDVAQAAYRQSSILLQVISERVRHSQTHTSESQKMRKAIKIASLYLERGENSGCDTRGLAWLIIDDQNAMIAPQDMTRAHAIN